MNETVEDILREMRAWADLERHRMERKHVTLFADRLEAAHKRDIKAVVDVNEIAMKTATDEVAKLREENERLKAALKDAIPWACLKCTFWNSRTARCSRGSGMCDQVWKWKQILGEAAK